MNLTIRRAQSTDLGKLVEFRIKLQEHMEKTNRLILRFNEDWKDTLYDSYEKKIKDQKSLFLVAEIKPKNPIGMAIGTFQEHPNFMIEKSVRIDDVWVERAFRRNNICKELLRVIIEHYKSRGIKLLVLNYAQNNIEAEKVWQKLGFQPAIHTCMHYLDTKT